MSINGMAINGMAISHSPVTGRIFNKEEFEEKTKKLIFCIVSNIHFPRIRVRFVRGITLLEKYPKGVIPLKDADKFFN